MKKKIVYFPLSFKIFSSFLILMAIMFTFYTIFSVSLFWSDKETSTYERIHYHLDSKSMLIEQYVQNQVVSFKSLFNTLKENGVQVDRSIFGKVDDLLEVVVFMEDGNEFKESMAILDEQKFPQYKFNIDTIKGRGENFNKYAYAVRKNGIYFHIVAGKRTLPYLLAGQYYPEQRKIVIFRLLLENFLAQIYKSGVIDHYLMDEDGNMLTHTTPTEIEERGVEYFEDIFKKAKYSDKDNLVQYIKTDQVNTILGYKKIPYVGLITISEITYAKAFRSARRFVFKIISYGILMLCISVLFASILAYFITGPLKKLIESLKEVSNRNFDRKVIINSRDEFEKLANTYNEMLDLIKGYIITIEEKNDELQRSNFTLEKKVNERTKELKDLNAFMKIMVNSINQGIMVFNDKGRCLPTFSKACETILGSSPKGKQINQIFQWNEEIAQNTGQWLTHIFNETLEFKDLVQLVPNTIESDCDVFSDQYKHIKIEYFPMKEAKNMIGLCAVVSDRTETTKANAKRDMETERATTIFKISTNIPIFIQYVNGTKKLIAEVKSCIEEKKVAVTDMMRNLHSIKGTSGLFALKKMVNMVHNYESNIKELTSNEAFDEEAFFNILKDVYENLSNELNLILEEYKEIVGASLQDGIERVEVKLPELEQFSQGFPSDNEMAQNLRKNFINSFLLVPAYFSLKVYNDIILELAPRLNKIVNPIKFNNKTTLIRHGQYKTVFANLIHVFRNSLDHGIETAFERTAAQKPEAGTISVDMKVENINSKEMFVLEIADDGRGIAIDKIRTKLQEKGIDASQESDEQLAMHIFDDDLSTSEAVTDISGRGVGMPAVKQSIEDLGGTIQLVSNIGKGTKFIIRLPYSIY